MILKVTSRIEGDFEGHIKDLTRFLKVTSVIKGDVEGNFEDLM